MKRITLRQLRVFEQVARLRSISAAAGACHLTQPAVSMQMKSLEQDCGLPLTERVGRQLRLTDAGEKVAVYARRIQHELAELEQQLDALRGRENGRLNVGIVRTAKYFASRMLATFTQQNPGAELLLQVENRAHILQLLVDNEIDLAIMGVPPDSLDAVALAFADHPHGIVLPAQHVAAQSKRLRLAELADATFLVREAGSGTRTVMERYFAAENFSPCKVVQMTGNEAIKQAVMAGLGIGFLSLNTVALERSLGLVSIPDMRGLPVVRRWHVVHRRGKQLLPMAQAFRDFISEFGATYADASSGAAIASPNPVRHQREPIEGSTAPALMASLPATTRRRGS